MAKLIETVYSRVPLAFNNHQRNALAIIDVLDNILKNSGPIN